MDTLRQTLESMKHQGNEGTLTELLRILKLKPRSSRKADAVERLYQFYNDPSAPAALYKRLSPYEKALLTCIVQNDYQPLKSDLNEIAVLHNYKCSENYYYYRYDYQKRFFPPQSYLFAFFLNDTVPPLFKAFLKQTIPPYTVTFQGVDVQEPENYAAIIGREERYKDFDMLLSFINNNKVSATKSGGYINKAALLKFHKIAQYDDICNNDSGELQDIRNAGETAVSYGMVQLLRCAQVIDVVQEKFVLSQNASQFAGLSMTEKACFLYDAYMQHGNRIIDECTRIATAKLKFSRNTYDLSGPRSEIIAVLTKCPVNQWIDFEKFSKEMFRLNHHLFEVAGEPMIRDDYYNHYYNRASWDQFEKGAISIVLLENLAVLGAVDVMAEETTYGDYGDYSAYETVYFRITDLGAYLFGMTDTYQAKQGQDEAGAENGFTVQPNFDVVVPNSMERMRHELFFDRFAERRVDDKAVSVYRLDFKAMASALNIGLTVGEIRAYCETHANMPVPDNVLTELAKWEQQSSSIRIRTVTVVETNDPYLLEEIKHYKGIETMLEGDVTPVLVMRRGMDKKVKTLIEKNKRFCILTP